MSDPARRPAAAPAEPYNPASRLEEYVAGQDEVEPAPEAIRKARIAEARAALGSAKRRTSWRDELPGHPDP